MQTIAEMKRERENILTRLENMKAQVEIEGRQEPNEQEIENSQALLDRVNRLDELIALQERINAAHELTKQPVDKPKTVDPGITRTVEYKDNKEFRTFGEQLVAVVNAENHPRELDARLTRASGLQEGAPSEGGFLVQEDFATELFRRTNEVGILFGRVRKFELTSRSNTLKMNGIDESSRASHRWGGIIAYWESEAGEKTSSKPKFYQMELNLKKLIGLCYATDELLEDAALLDNVIKDGFAEEFGFQLDDAIYEGTGAGMPLGMLNCGSGIEVTRTESSHIMLEDIKNMWARMWGPCRNNAIWLYNQDCEPDLMDMGFCLSGESGCGIPVWMPSNSIAGRPHNTLLGRPAIPFEHCKSLGTVGDIAFVDPTQYLMITKGGMQSASSIHVRFIYDESVFRFVMRVDGQCMWNSHLTPHEGSNTLSPYVFLAT